MLFHFQQYLERKRCFLPSISLDQCNAAYIVNLSNDYKLIQAKTLTNATVNRQTSQSSYSYYNRSTSYEAVQINPQRVSLKLRISKWLVLYSTMLCLIYFGTAQPQTKSSSFYEAPTVTTNLPFLMISGFWHGVNEIVLFWDFTLHTMLVSCQFFGTPYHFHCQGFKLSCLKSKESAHNFFFLASSSLWLLKIFDYVVVVV